MLFEPGGFNNAVSFEDARSALATETRVCSYDRMGAGWSDPAPGPVSAGVLANDLRQLQDEANLGARLVIATTSIGGLTTEMFARRYPDQVAALLFADAASSEVLPIASSTIRPVQLNAICLAIDAAARTGVVRLLDPFGLRTVGSPAAERSAALLYGAKPWRALCSLVRNRETTEQEFAEAPPLRPDLPLIVLTAESDQALLPARLERTRLAQLTSLRIAVTRFRESQQRFASRSTRGSWRLVAGSSHQVASSQPTAVIDAVRELLRDIK